MVKNLDFCARDVSAISNAHWKWEAKLILINATEKYYPTIYFLIVTLLQ